MRPRSDIVEAYNDAMLTAKADPGISGTACRSARAVSAVHGPGRRAHEANRDLRKPRGQVSGRGMAGRAFRRYSELSGFAAGAQAPAANSKSRNRILLGIETANTGYGGDGNHTRDWKLRSNRKPLEAIGVGVLSPQPDISIYQNVKSLPHGRLSVPPSAESTVEARRAQSPSWNGENLGGASLLRQFGLSRTS